MGNVIYRGPVANEPQTVNGLVAGAYLPGRFVTYDGTNLTAATSGTGRLLLLSNRRFYDQGPTDAYASGDTGVAYRLSPEEEYQAIFAAGTYNYEDPLTVDSDGRMAAATTGDIVVAYYQGTDGATLTNDDLADVVIAKSYAAA